MMLHQISKLKEDIAGTENYYIQVIRLVRLDTGRLHSLKSIELSGGVPQAYFHFPSIASRLLIARAERAGALEDHEEARAVPNLELIRVHNTNKIHNYIFRNPNELFI